MVNASSPHMLARNTLVQLLAAYTNPESQNAQCHRHRRTTGRCQQPIILCSSTIG